MRPSSQAGVPGGYDVEKWLPVTPNNAGQAAPELWHWFPTRKGPRQPSLPSPGPSEEMDYFSWSGTGRMASGRGTEPAHLGWGGIGFPAPGTQGNAPIPSERKEERPLDEALAHR